MSMRFSAIADVVAAAERLGNTPAIIDRDQVIGFVELTELVLKLTSVLLANGVRAGDVIALNLGNVWEYVALELAVPNAGAIVLPMSLAFGEYELAQTLQRAGARFVVCHPDRAETLHRITQPLANPPQVLVTSKLVHALQGAPASAIMDGDARRIVEIAVTSGTSGLPKLASRSGAQKQATYESFTGRMQVGEGDRVLAMSPFTQGVGSMSLHSSRRGACQVMLGSARFMADEVLALVAEHRVSMLIGVPTNVQRLMDAPGFDGADLSTCRVTAVAGALFPADLAQEWERVTGSRVCIFYGSMDAGQLSAISPTDPPEKRWHTVGRPHDCCEVIIQGPQGESLPAGEVGEICMRGGTVQDGYWGESRSAYAADGWAHLGDLGLLDGEGFLHVVGRAKDIIIRGGSNINPYEVESVLRGHPDIRDVCIVSKPDRELGERAVAFVAVRAGARFGIDSLRSYLADSGLAKYKWPEFVQEIDEIPLSGPGKVSREQLRSLIAAGGDVHDPEP